MALGRALGEVLEEPDGLGDAVGDVPALGWALEGVPLAVAEGVAVAVGVAVGAGEAVARRRRRTG